MHLGKQWHTAPLMDEIARLSVTESVSSLIKLADTFAPYNSSLCPEYSSLWHTNPEFFRPTPQSFFDVWALTLAQSYSPCLEGLLFPFHPGLIELFSLNNRSDYCPFLLLSGYSDEHSVPR